jgi:hypothetical protein
MRPNLSLEHLAATIAALGTGIIVAACGGPSQDVKASEVPASKPLPWQGDKACAAHGCGASPAASSSGDPGGASASAPATSAAAGSGASAAPTAATTATTTAPATPAPTATAQAAAPKPAPKPVAKKPKPAAGDASCGQGTCSADPKKM